MGNEADNTLMTTAMVRARYGNVSHMWIERRLNDDSEFPKPLYIAKRRFWYLNDLVAWERKQVVKA
jgi:hypothetical protein